MLQMVNISHNSVGLCGPCSSASHPSLSCPCVVCRASPARLHGPAPRLLVVGLCRGDGTGQGRGDRPVGNMKAPGVSSLSLR